jgi:predicted O-methyltransferase YrrM
VGISSAYQALALQLNGQNGRLITMEVSPYRLRLAKQLHRNVGLGNVVYVEGLFSETLDSTLINIDGVDFAFIDGHHQYQSTLDYFQKILSHSKENAIFVFDDIRWSHGMKKAWSKIQSDDKIEMSADLHSMGLCVAAREPPSTRYQFPSIYSVLV